MVTMARNEKSPTELFPGLCEGGSLSCGPLPGGTDDLDSVHTPSADDFESRARALLRAVAQVQGDASQSPSEMGTDSPMVVDPVICPQREPPFLFVPWAQVAGERGLPIFHKDGDSCHEDFDKVLAQEGCFIPGEKEFFLQANEALFQQWKKQ